MRQEGNMAKTKTAAEPVRVAAKGLPMVRIDELKPYVGEGCGREGCGGEGCGTCLVRHMFGS